MNWPRNVEKSVGKCWCFLKECVLKEYVSKLAKSDTDDGYYLAEKGLVLLLLCVRGLALGC